MMIEVKDRDNAAISIISQWFVDGTYKRPKRVLFLAELVRSNKM